MKIFKTLFIAFPIMMVLSFNSFAGETHSGRAVMEAGKAGSHASASAGHAIAGSAQVTSAVSAAPLFVIGAVGAVSTEIAIELMEVATAPIGAPLEITDECVTAGPAPDNALKEKI